MKHLAVILALMWFLGAEGLSAQEPGLDTMTGKTVLVFTPHPDDELFGAGGNDRPAESTPQQSLHRSFTRMTTRVPTIRR